MARGWLSGVGFEGEVLGDAVVEEGEVRGAEGVDEVAGGGGDEGRDDDEVGGDGEGGGGLGEGRRGGKKQSEGEACAHGGWTGV